MRFRFCGDLDCPDWVLAEIATLAKLTSVKMKLLCVQVLKELLGEAIDYEKVTKLTADAKFEAGDQKAGVAALSLILTSAAGHGVSAEDLNSELQQLGLPKEHATGLCKSYGDGAEKLRAELKTRSLRVNCLDSVKWRVDYIIGSSQLKVMMEPQVRVQLNVRDPDTQTVVPVAFTMTRDKFMVFSHEMRQAHNAMTNLSSVQ